MVAKVERLDWDRSVCPEVAHCGHWDSPQHSSAKWSEV